MKLLTGILLILLWSSYALSQAQPGFQVEENHTVLFGQDTTGAGVKAFWLPSKAAFRAGGVGSISVGGINYNSDEKSWNPDSIGLFSFAVGLGPVASGVHSTAMGWGSKAIGSRSTAIGSFTTSKGFAGVALGENTITRGDYGVALGYQTIAGGDYSLSMGEESRALGHHAKALGPFVLANGFASTVLGMYNDTIDQVQTLITDTTRLFIIGNGNSGTERSNAMVVQKNGNVGIGTNSPDAKLEVEGKVKITQMQQTNSADSMVVWLQDSILGFRDISMLGKQISDSDGDTKIVLEQTPDDDIIRMISRDSQILIIDSIGNIGVGDPNPSEALTLKGRNFLQRPVDPTLVSNSNIGDRFLSVYVSGHYAYLIDWDQHELVIVDISDPYAPSVHGRVSTGVSSFPEKVYVSGRYAYVILNPILSGSLAIIDVSNPANPNVVSTLTIGNLPSSIHVSGPYAYITDRSSDDLKVIDISDPTTPKLVGDFVIGSNQLAGFMAGRYVYALDNFSIRLFDVSDPTNPNPFTGFTIGPEPTAVYVSGRYAYVIDRQADDLKVLDVLSSSIVGSIMIGSEPSSIYVSGRYAFITDFDTDDLKIIDVSDPTLPSLVGKIEVGFAPLSVFVSGRYAYVASASGELKIYDVSGAEVTAMMAHSIETGNLQVRNDIIAQGQVQITSGLNVGTGGIYSKGALGINGSSRIRGNLALGNLSPQTSSDIRLSMKTAGSWQAHLEQTASSVFSIYNGGQQRLSILSNGRVGIGTINPSTQLHTTGGVRFANFGAGTLMTDANGNISVSSDIRLKNVIEPFQRGVLAITKLQPIYYTWNEKSGMITNQTYAGFSAQNVQQAIPEAVGKNDDGYLTLSDRPLIASLVNAIKEQQEQIEQLQQEVEQLKILNEKVSELERVLPKNKTNQHLPKVSVN